MKKNITYKEILTKKYYDYYNDGNFELYDIQDVYYPYFKVTCSCIFKKKSKLLKVEEIFLKTIQCGIENYAKLQVFLALDQEILEEIAGKLKSEDLYIENPMPTLTPQGEKILHDNGKIEIVEDEKYIVLDGMSGHISHTQIQDDKKGTTSNNATILKIQIPYPKNETLDRIIDNKALQTILFEGIKNLDKQKGERELYEIKEISDKPYKFHKKYSALFFKNKEEETKILILQDGEPNDEITNLLNDSEENSQSLFNFSNNAQSEHDEQFKAPTIQEYSQIETLKDGKTLTTYEHPKFFDFLFKYSKKEIIIISPWIKWEIIQKRQTDIEDALKRQVKVYFFYGMGKKNDIDDKSKEFFQKMQDQYKDQFYFSTGDKDDHSKIIICDRSWAIATSFNWTSFEGDTNRKERGEMGTFLNDASEVQTLVRRYL